MNDKSGSERLYEDGLKVKVEMIDGVLVRNINAKPFELLFIIDSLVKDLVTNDSEKAYDNIILAIKEIR